MGSMGMKTYMHMQHVSAHERAQGSRSRQQRANHSRFVCVSTCTGVLRAEDSSQGGDKQLPIGQVPTMYQLPKNVRCLHQTASKHNRPVFCSRRALSTFVIHHRCVQHDCIRPCCAVLSCADRCRICLASCGHTCSRQMMLACLSALQDTAWVSYTNTR